MKQTRKQRSSFLSLDKELELPELRGNSKENYNPIRLENIETLKTVTKLATMALPSVQRSHKPGWQGIRSTR